MAKKALHVVQVSYTAKHYPGADLAFNTAVGKDSEASGMGFGERDLRYYFTNPKLASNAAKRARAVKGIRKRVTVDIEGGP